METFINIEKQKRLDKANKLLNDQPATKEKSKKLFQQTLALMYHDEQTHESYAIKYSKKMSEKNNTYHKIYYLLLNKEYELAKSYYESLEKEYKDTEFTKSINKIYKEYNKELNNFKKSCKEIIFNNNLSTEPLKVLKKENTPKTFLDLAKTTYPKDIYEQLFKKARKLQNILK